MLIINLFVSDDSTEKSKPQIPIGDDLRQRILQRVKSKKIASQTTMPRKLTPNELAHILGDSSLNHTDTSHIETLDVLPPYKKRKTTEIEVTQDIKIKTLEEIRAERSNRPEIFSNPSKDSQTRKRTHSAIKLSRNMVQPGPYETNKREVEEAEVSSTSNDEPDTQKNQIPLKPLRKLNLKKIIAVSEETNQTEVIRSETESIMREMKTNSEEDVGSTSKNNDLVLDQNKIGVNQEQSMSSKNIEESLLLLDDDVDMSINIKSEDDLFNEIDILLED